MRRSLIFALNATAFGLTAASLGACSGQSDAPPQTATTVADGTAFTVRDTSIAETFSASGTAEPWQQATISTKLMGVVTTVRVHEGDRVRAGQALVEIDARDLAAKASQVAASISDADAMQREAAAHAARFRALYADSAATRAQFDAAETGLARADAGLRAARAGAAELDAMRSYATLRAPFAGTVSMRSIDPGALASPGLPLVTVQDDNSLRLTVSAPADVVRPLARGRRVRATIDGAEVRATIEGIVPAGAGNLYTVNAAVPNAAHTYRVGSAAILYLPLRARAALLVPSAALVREGDLVGVVVRRGAVDERRWIRVGDTTTTHVEVLSGLRAGDVIVVPGTPNAPHNTPPRGARG